MTTVFSKIIEGTLPCNKVYENEHLIAFHDIHPLAPVHILIVPKKEIKALQYIDHEDLYLMSEVIKAAQLIAKEFNIEEGYRLITNNGVGAGQSVFHLHFHLIGGRSLGSIG